MSTCAETEDTSTILRRAQMGAVSAWESADGVSKIKIPTLESSGAATQIAKLKNAGANADDVLDIIRRVFECGQECGNINTSKLYANLLSYAPRAWPEHLMPKDPKTLEGMESLLASLGHPGHVIPKASA